MSANTVFIFWCVLVVGMIVVGFWLRKRERIEVCDHGIVLTGYCADCDGDPRDWYTKAGWMDSIHFNDHLEGDSHPVPIYKSAEICKAHQPCIDTDGHCTAKKVAVMPWEQWEELRKSALAGSK